MLGLEGIPTSYWDINPSGFESIPSEIFFCLSMVVPCLAMVVGDDGTWSGTPLGEEAVPPLADIYRLSQEIRHLLGLDQSVEIATKPTLVQCVDTFFNDVYLQFSQEIRLHPGIHLRR